MQELIYFAFLFAPLAGAFVVYNLVVGFAHGMRYQGSRDILGALAPFAITILSMLIGAAFTYMLDLPQSAIPPTSVFSVLVITAYLLYGIGIYAGLLAREHKLLKVKAVEPVPTEPYTTAHSRAV